MNKVKMRRIFLKKVFLTLLPLLLFFFLIVVSTNAASSGGKVIVYVATSLDKSGPIFEAFTTETGIDVEVIQAGTGELWSRVRAEKGKPLGDILWAGSNKMFEADKPKDLFASYASSEDKYYPIVDPDHIWHAFAVPGGFNSLMINTNLIAPEDYPKSWRDLTDIKYNGMIALLNPTYSGTGFIAAQAMIHLAKTQWGYEDGWDFLRQLMMNCKIYVSSGASRKAVRDSEIAMGIVTEGHVIDMLKDKFPVKLLSLKEGIFGGLDAIGIIKDGPHPDKAKIFIDWFLGEKAQQLVAAQKWRSIREGITLDKDFYTYSFGDNYTYIDIPDYLFKDYDKFKKKWNGVMGEAVLLKGKRDVAYDRIEFANTSIEEAKKEGRTVGIEEAESLLADAMLAFNEGKYKDAKALATKVLKLSSKARKP